MRPAIPARPTGGSSGLRFALPLLAAVAGAAMFVLTGEHRQAPRVPEARGGAALLARLPVPAGARRSTCPEGACFTSPQPLFLSSSAEADEAATVALARGMGLPVRPRDVLCRYLHAGSNRVAVLRCGAISLVRGEAVALALTTFGYDSGATRVRGLPPGSSLVVFDVGSGYTEVPAELREAALRQTP